MMDMQEHTTSLEGFQKDFPFESQLSLGVLIRFWEEQAKESSLRGETARSVLARLGQVPELMRPIDDITLLDDHSDLVDALMSAVFPSAFLEKAYMGALIPFTLRSVYGTRAFDTIMGADGVLYGSLNLEMHALKDFRLVNAYALALERLYGIEFPVDYPLILTLPEPETGLDRHFKIQFDGRFVDVDRLAPIPPLADEMRQRLSAQALDLAGLATLIPAGSVRFSGFTVVKAADVTDQEVLSSIKRDLIDKESIVSNARFASLQAKLRTLFRRPGLHLGLAAVEGDRVLVLNDAMSHEHACIFADSAHHKTSEFAGSLYERAVLQDRPLIIDDLMAWPDRTKVEDELVAGGARTFVCAPLHYQDRVIGTLELISRKAGDLN